VSPDTTSSNIERQADTYRIELLNLSPGIRYTVKFVTVSGNEESVETEGSFYTSELHIVFTSPLISSCIHLVFRTYGTRRDHPKIDHN
jgi:hypothetical protein